MRGFEHMKLANMRLNGVRSVIAACANCERSTDVNVDLLPETLTVPEVGRAPLQPMRRQDHLDPTRLAYGAPTPGNARLSPRTAADLIGQAADPTPLQRAAF